MESQNRLTAAAEAVYGGLDAVKMLVNKRGKEALTPGPSRQSVLYQAADLGTYFCLVAI